MQKVFSVNIDSTDEVVYFFKISGELRRGTQLSGSDWVSQLNQARDQVEKEDKKLIVDLTELKYWDTGGMADIIGLIANINANPLSKSLSKRAALIQPKLEHLLKISNLVDFARRKFPSLTLKPDDIPVLKNNFEIKEFIEG